MHVQFHVTQEEVGYSARAEGLPIVTQGDTFEELHSNIKDALSCHFEKPYAGTMDVTLHETVG